MKRLLFLLSILALPIVALSAEQQDSDRFIRQLTLPDGQIIMVAEGDQEPRSAGSYSIRLYLGTEPKFPTDDFLHGLIRERDGSIEDVKLDDSTNKNNPAIIVIIKSAGSGGYLSADQFHLSNNNRQLQLTNTVNGLENNVDPIKALQSNKN